MSKIKKIQAREILDSRGNPTVEVEVEIVSGVKSSASVPSGASTGTYEALELRDGNSSRYHGMGVQKAVNNVNGEIAEALIGMEVSAQKDIDQKMIQLDGTENKSNLGANAILGVSLAAARVAAIEDRIHLYEHIKNTFQISGEYKLPIPMFNVINGGLHSDSGLSIQEFKIVPNGIEVYKEQLRAGSEIFFELKKIILSKKGYSIGVGDEGGFSPRLGSNEEAFEYINEAIGMAGYEAGKEVNVGVDAAANSFYDEKIGEYAFWAEGIKLSREKLLEKYGEWIEKYNVISIEDGLNENDWEGWRKMNEKMGGNSAAGKARIILIGDDLLVTNVKRLEKAIAEKACNAVLIKVNQIGTLSETIDCVKMAKENGMKTIVSHRSGETTDDFIADLAVAVGADFIKTGSLSRGERICKYNRLLKIQDHLGQSED